MLLSIIIPTYNAEKYIADCLCSAINQNLTTDEYEILVIDDGSKDRTAQIVHSFKVHHKNLYLISHKGNLGNGAARNTGIDRALGEYICFIDSDDYIAHYSIHKLIKVARINHLDVLFHSIKHVKDSTKIISETVIELPQKFVVDNGIAFIAKNSFRDEVWNYLVKRNSLLNSKIRYYDDRRFSQDMYLTTQILTKATRAIYIPFDFYRYRKTPNSIVNKKSNDHIIKHLYDVLFALEKCFNLRNSLIEKNEKNYIALLRLHDKQQTYAYLIITRFIQTNLPFTELQNLISKFKVMNIYPFRQKDVISNFNDKPKIRALTFIYNKTFLLKTLLYLYRRFKSLN